MLIKFVGKDSGLGGGKSVPVKCKGCGKTLKNKGSRESIEICNKCKRGRS
jgi:hypothetical protein